MGALGTAGQSLSYRDAEVVDLTLSGPAVEYSAGLWVREHHVGHRAGTVLPIRASCWAEEEGKIRLAVPRAAPGWWFPFEGFSEV